MTRVVVSSCFDLLNKLARFVVTVLDWDRAFSRIMDKPFTLTDKEGVRLIDREVVHGLSDSNKLHTANDTVAAIHLLNKFTNLQVTCIDPLLVASKEWMRRCGFDGLPINDQINSHFIRMRNGCFHRIIAKLACPLVIGKDVIAYLDRTDRYFAIVGSNLCVGTETVAASTTTLVVTVAFVSTLMVLVSILTIMSRAIMITVIFARIAAIRTILVRVILLRVPFSGGGGSSGLLGAGGRWDHSDCRPLDANGVQ